MTTTKKKYKNTHTKFNYAKKIGNGGSAFESIAIQRSMRN
jgi:hypothetical protein